MDFDWPWVLQVVGLVGGFALALHLWRSLGEPVETAIHLLIPGAALIFVGGKLLFWMERGTPAAGRDLLDPGYSGFGALILVVLFWLALSRVYPFPVPRFFDAVAPAAALGLFFGRLACFLRGCCGGTPTDLPWGVRFPPGSVLYSTQVADGLIPRGSSTSLPAHPAQLYEAIFALGACLLLRRMIGTMHRRNGDVFAAARVCSDRESFGSPSRRWRYHRAHDGWIFAPERI